MNAQFARHGSSVIRRFNIPNRRLPSINRDAHSPGQFVSTSSLANPVLPLRLSKTYATAAAKTKTKTKTQERTANESDTSKTPKKTKATGGKDVKRAKDQQKEEIKTLKAAALTIPKRLPVSKFPVFMSGKEGGIVENREAFKNLSEAKLAELEQIAKSNVDANRIAFERWVESSTPLEIKTANAARRKLRRLTKSKQYRDIPDGRQIKSPRSAYMLFMLESMRNGESKHLSAKERITELARSWKQMSDSEQEKYRQLSEQDRVRYAEEYKATYGQEPNMTVKKSKAKA